MRTATVNQKELGRLERCTETNWLPEEARSSGGWSGRGKTTIGEDEWSEALNEVHQHGLRLGYQSHSHNAQVDDREPLSYIRTRACYYPLEFTHTCDLEYIATTPPALIPTFIGLGHRVLNSSIELIQ